MSNKIGAVFSIKDEFSSKIKAIIKATNQAEQGTKKAVEQVNKFGTSFKDDISSKVYKATKAIKDTDSSAQKSSRSIKDFGGSFRDDISPKVSKVTTSFTKAEQVSKTTNKTVNNFGKDFKGDKISEKLTGVNKSFEKAEKSASSSSKTISARVNEMNDSFEKASQKSETLRGRLANVFKAKFANDAKNIADGTKKTEKAFNDSESAARKFGASVSGGFAKAKSGVGQLLTVIGVTKAVSGAFNMIKGGVEKAFGRIDVMEQFERTMTTITGSAEDTKKALDQTTEAVTGTGYGLDVAAKSVQDFVTRGMDITKATDVVKTWGDAVAFYGDGSNGQLSRGSVALGKMTSKGKVEMDQLNTLFDAGIDAVGMYAKATNKNVNDVSKALSKGEISSTDFINVVTDAMENGTNGVEKIAGAAKEAGASWGAAMDNMKARVAIGVTNVIKSIDSMLESKGLPQMRDMVEAFGNKFRDVLNSVADYVPVAADKIEGFYNKLKNMGAIDAAKSALTGVKDAVILLKNNMDLVIPVVAGVVGAMTAFKVINGVMKGVDIAVGAYKAWSLATQTQTTAQWLLNAAMTANPVGIAVVAIGALIAAGVALYMNWDKVSAKASELWTTVKTKFGQIKESMSQSLGSAVDYVKDKFNAFTGFIQSIPEKFSAFVSRASAYVQQLPERVAFSVGYIIGYLSTIPSRSVAFFLSLRDRAVAAMNEMRERVSLSISNMITRSVTYLSALPGRVLAFFSSAKTSATNQASQLASGVVSFISSLPGKLSSIFSKAVTAVTNGARRMYTGAIDWVKKIPEKITEIISGALGKVTNMIDKVRNSFSRGFKTSVSVSQRTSSTGPGGIPVNGSHKTGLNRVPFDGYVAKLHKDEMVLRKDEANSYRKGNVGSDQGNTTIRENKSNTSNITININHPVIREEQDIKKITTEIARNLKRASINSI